MEVKWPCRLSVEDMPMGLKKQGNTVLSPTEEREIEALTAQAQLPLDGVLRRMPGALIALSLAGNRDPFADIPQARTPQTQRSSGNLNLPASLPQPSQTRLRDVRRCRASARQTDAYRRRDLGPSRVALPHRAY